MYSRLPEHARPRLAVYTADYGVYMLNADAIGRSSMVSGFSMFHDQQAEAHVAYINRHS